VEHVPLPPLSSGGALVAQPWLRFHTPLTEPDRQVSCIRLSDKTSRLRPRHVVPKPTQAYEPEVPVEVREWIVRRSISTPRTCTHARFRTKRQSFLRFKRRGLMHISGATYAHLVSKGGGQEFESLRRRIAAERTLTQVTEENPISMS
jgi:hypothetical protein